MSYNNFLQMTTILESTAGDTWVEQVSNIIVQPIFTLILTCLTFLGFVYQLYSKNQCSWYYRHIIITYFILGFLIQGNVNMHSILIFSIGVILVVIELFVVGAVIGIIGMILITISITTLGDNLLFMLANVIVALILTIVEWVILVKIFNRKIPFLDKVILKDSTNSESGYNSHDNRSHLVGKTAQTVTDLRAVGIIFVKMNVLMLFQMATLFYAIKR